MRYLRRQLDPLDATVRLPALSAGLIWVVIQLLPPRTLVGLTWTLRELTPQFFMMVGIISLLVGFIGIRFFFRKAANAAVADLKKKRLLA